MIEAADISIRPARNIADALKSAARTALVAFGLFALLIGLRTDQGPSGALELMPRWTALAIIVALAFAGGLVRALAFGERTIELAGGGHVDLKKGGLAVVRLTGIRGELAALMRPRELALIAGAPILAI